MPRERPPDPDEQDRSFPDAETIHRAILAEPAAHPEGWVEQARFRERYDLPPFRPPRFVDGGPVHETVTRLAEHHDVAISFAASDADERPPIADETRSGSGDGTVEWVVELDGVPAFPIGRRRDDGANTILEVTEAAFRRQVERGLAERRCSGSDGEQT